MRILITGGAGFVGSAFARLLARERPAWTLVVLDKLTYAGNLRNLEEIAGRFVFLRGDIAEAEEVRRALTEHQIEAIVNFAAESHVDRSIFGGTEFARTDVVGTVVLLEEGRRAGVRRFLQVGTDEVYGSMETGRWTEESPLRPNSPYSASKAGADLQVRAAWATHRFPAMVTRGSNTYGPYQYPEKVIPLFVTNLLEDKKVPLYGDGLHCRDWLYVDDHARGILTVLERGSPGEIYNLGSAEERTNLDLTRTLLRILQKGEEFIEHVADRPGHDRRYALDSAKAASLGWQPQFSFDEGLRRTVAWYRAREDWWRPLKSGEYSKYYQQQYAGRPVETAAAPRA